MAKTNLTISIDSDLIESLDRLVAARLFPDRNRAVEEAIRDQLDRLALARLARSSDAVDPRPEPDLALEGLTVDAGEWSEY
jgi:hypothetical protein